jgi:murein DD-endopeptidase MepM/ murein hydrolase activator NlpD
MTLLLREVASGIVSTEPSATQSWRTVGEHDEVVPPPFASARTTLWVAATVAMLLSLAGSTPALAGAAAPGAAAHGAAAAFLERDAAGSWAWPVQAPHPVTRGFEAPESRFAAGHRGIDIAAASGTVVVAPSDGEVYFAGAVVDRPVLSIRHGAAVLTSYEPVSTTLVAGDRVLRGQVIGEVAPAGAHCDRNCLHFGVRVHGDYVSPLTMLGGIPRSVLLPTREPP